MAKAIVKAVADELGKRKTFGVAAGFERGRFAYGPFHSEADAKRYATRLAASGLDTRVAGLLGPDAYVMDAEPTKKSSKCACGHLAHMHGVWQGHAGPGPGGCAWKGCRCGAMTQRRHEMVQVVFRGSGPRGMRCLARDAEQARRRGAMEGWSSTSPTAWEVVSIELDDDDEGIPCDKPGG